MSPLRLEANQTQRDDSDEGEECGEEERLFHIRQDCRMVFILQEALYKCEQVITLLAERWAVMSVFISGAMKNFVKTLGWHRPLNFTVSKLSGVFRLQETTANSQAMEDLKEQMELKRLYANCDQVWLYQEFFQWLPLIQTYYWRGKMQEYHILTSLCMLVKVEKISTSDGVMPSACFILIPISFNMITSLHLRTWSLHLSW